MSQTSSGDFKSTTRGTGGFGAWYEKLQQEEKRDRDLEAGFGLGVSTKDNRHNRLQEVDKEKVPAIIQFYQDELIKQARQINNKIYKGHKERYLSIYLSFWERFFFFSFLFLDIL